MITNLSIILTHVWVVCKEKIEYGTEKYVYKKRKGDLSIERIFN